MNNIPTTPPSGFRDFTPADCVLRAKAIETISRVYRSFGFSPISTSAVEDLAVLLGKGGGENEKLIFKILKRGEKLEEARNGGELADLGLRFDLTLPLARYYSKYGSTLPHPFKAFNIGPVWRAERAQKGRYREFYQCDADIIGSDSWSAEVDVISAILTAFKELGIPDVEVVLNDRTFVYDALSDANVPEDRRIAACVIIDKQDKLPREKMLGELAELVGIEAMTKLQETLLTTTPNRNSPIGKSPFARLDAIAAAISGKARIDPSLMRGFDYYTSTVFEFRHAKFSGSIGGGGRYDKLTEKFGGQPVPACGASIGFERMLLILAESGAVALKSGKRVCVTIFDESLRQKTLEIAAGLRGKNIPGLCVDVYPGAGKLKAQFKYADTTGADFALVMGPDESAKGKINRKDLKTGEEAAMTFDELARSLS